MRTTHTPSSLKWLINKKARISGEIHYLENTLPIYLETTRVALEKAERQVRDLRITYDKAKEQQEKKLPKLRAQLDAIITAFSIHEIQINPELVAPIKPKAAATFAHGQVTRSIFEFFRLGISLNRNEVSTKEVALFMAKKFQIDETQISLAKLTEIVRARLKNLAREGKIVRNRNKQNLHEGTWSLPS